MIEQKFTTLFSTSIYVGKYVGNIDELLIECESERLKSKGRICSNIGGWQSNDFDGLKLQKFVSHQLQEVAQEWGIYDSLTLGNYWYNINTSVNQNHPHTHPGSILSGIIYLRCPLNCSPIVFLNPNHLLISSYINSLANFSSNSNLSFDYAKFPSEGDLIIFPSWLEHYVPHGNYEGERISLSFNVSNLNKKP